MTAHTPAAPIQRPFSDAYLLAYSDEHLLYECDMFFWLAQTLGGGARLGAASQADTTRISNVLIEGFAVHLRNVVDFLYLDNPKKTDVIAADFCATGVWPGVRPAISATLEGARVRANKEIAHLTTDRISGSAPHKAWAFTQLAAELRPLLQLVPKHAEPGRLGPRVEGLIR